MAGLAQNEMRAKADMPEHVRSNEGLGGTLDYTSVLKNFDCLLKLR